VETDSPAEFSFAEQLCPFLKDQDALKTQVEVPTSRGTFRLDFLFQCPRFGPVGIEIDGAEFHCFWRDRYRDALILVIGGANVIYRISARDVYRYRYDASYWLYTFHPELFALDSVQKLCRCARRDAPWEGHLPQLPSDMRRHYERSPVYVQDMEWYADEGFPTRDIVGTSTIEARIGSNPYGLAPWGQKELNELSAHPNLTLGQMVEKFHP
jgi:hypothetical protein